MSVIQFSKSNDGLLELRFEVEILFCVFLSSDHDSSTSFFWIGIISFRMFNDEYKNPTSDALGECIYSILKNGILCL